MYGVLFMNSKGIEVEKVNEYKVKCDGGSGGHPRVWLQISSKENFVVCPYCEKRFELVRTN